MAETTVLKSSASPKIPKPASASAEATLTGPLPVVKVSMGSGGQPAIQGQGSGKPGVVILAPKNQRRSGVVIGPIGSIETVHPDPLAITPDQLLLCRHLVAGHITKLDPADVLGAELAKSTLIALDDTLSRSMERATPPIRPVVVASSGSRAANASAPRRVDPIIDVESAESHGTA